MVAPGSPRIFIGIGHKKQRGKDTFAGFLMTALERYGVGRAVKVSFADPLKRLAMAVFGLTYEQCYGTDEQKNSQTQITCCDADAHCRTTHYWLTARQVLQHLGVAMRKAWPGIWSRAPMRRAYDPAEVFVLISDTRFPDDADNIKEAGGFLIRVDRADAPDTDGHSSEQALNDYSKWNMVINNDHDLEHLEKCTTFAAAVIAGAYKEKLGL